MSESSVAWEVAPPPPACLAAAPFAALATDLDGTLLDGQSSLTPAVIALVAALRDAGVPVFLVTGRMTGSTLRFHQTLGLDTPIGCYNGAKVHYPGGEVLYQRFLPAGLAPRVAAWCEARGLQLNFYHDERVFSAADTATFRWYSTTYGANVTVNPDAAADRRPPAKLLIITAPGRAPEVKIEVAAAFGDDAFVTTSSDRFVELIPADADKGTALVAIAERLGLAPEKVVAVGDGENDRPMLEAAGLGVAVRHAVPELLAKADWIVEPLPEGGLARLARVAFGVDVPERL